MAEDNFQQAWQSYQQAVRALYRAPAEAARDAERGAGEVFAENLAAQGDQTLAQAEAVRQALEPSLASFYPGESELAGLKLIAAAAFDLSVAGDILALEEGGPGAQLERGPQMAVLASPEFRSILEAPLEEGTRGLVEVERGPLPQDPEAAREALRQAVTGFLKDIPDSASGLGVKAVSGVANLGFGPAQKAFSLAFQEILALVPEGVSGAAAKAGKLAMEGLRKVRAALGQEQEQEIRQKAADWLEEVKENRDAVAALLDRLYEIERLGQEAMQEVEGAPQGLEAEAFNYATRGLEELSGRYSKTRGLLDKFMIALALLKPALMGAVPWGPVALYSTYAGILGYAVYSGGDYLDWYRTGDYIWLDRVDGLRNIIHGIVPKEAANGDGDFDQPEAAMGNGDYDEPRE